MQNAKDTFYEVLRGRLEALNPERTAVIREVSRPGILVEENEFVTAVHVPDCFRLRWTDTAVDPDGVMPLAAMQCVIEYETAGGAMNGGMDRGRALAGMDGELQSMLNAAPQRAIKNNYVGLASGKPAVPMATSIWWSSPQFGNVEIKEDRIARSATVAVMSYQEAGEL